MALLSALKAEIADDIARSDLSSQIGNAILASIEEYEGERFWFNETRAYTFATVAATSDYTLTPSATIADFIKVDWVQILVGGRPINLDRGDPTVIDWRIAAQANSGQPYEYAFYDQKFRLWPVPNAIYTVRVAGHYKLVTLTADSQTNAWTTEAYELIRAAAKVRLYALVIKNAEQAAVEDQAKQRALAVLRSKTTDKIGTGIIRPTQF